MPTLADEECRWGERPVNSLAPKLVAKHVGVADDVLQDTVRIARGRLPATGMVSFAHRPVVAVVRQAQRGTTASIGRLAGT